MLKDIYIYENRDLVYLRLYEKKARHLNLNVTVIGPDHLKNSRKR